MAIPQDVLSTAASKSTNMSKYEANYRAQTSRTATMSTPANIHSPSDNTSNATRLLSSSNISPPVTVRNTKDLSNNSPFLILSDGGRNPRTDFRDQSISTQSPIDHMTKSQTLATGRSFMYATIIDIPPETPLPNPAKLSISPIYSIYSSVDSCIDNSSQEITYKKVSSATISPNSDEKLYINGDIDTPRNGAQQGVISDQIGQIGPGSEGRRYPESAKCSAIVESQDQEKRLHLETKLNSLHLKCLQSRSLGYEKRTRLRYSRAEMRVADEDFMRHVREKWIQDSPVNLALNSSFERLQTARKEYGSLEESYDEHEERLDRDEYNVTVVQNSMLSGISLAQGGENDAVSLSSSAGEEGSDDLEGIDIQKPYHPLYEEYLSRLGDLNLWQEKHFNLVSEYNALLEQQEMRQKYGEPVHSQTEITLAKFPRAESKILERLEKIEADVKRLRRACIREGLFSQGEDEECVSDGGESDILTIPNGSPNFQQGEYLKYSLLLEQLDHRKNGERSDTLNTRLKEDGIGDRITRWLLHKLRSSYLEVELLARYSEGLVPTVDTEKWQQDVLDFWFIDDANLPVSAYLLEPTLTNFTPSSTTNLERVALTRFGNTEHIQLVIRSSSLSRKLEFGMLLRLARMKGKSARSVI